MILIKLERNEKVFQNMENMSIAQNEKLWTIHLLLLSNMEQPKLMGTALITWIKFKKYITRAVFT